MTLEYMKPFFNGDFKSERFTETSEPERFTYQYFKITSLFKFSHK